MILTRMSRTTLILQLFVLIFLTTTSAAAARFLAQGLPLPFGNISTLDTALPPTDDDSSDAYTLPLGGMTFYGQVVEQVYLSINGYLTFGAPKSNFSPQDIIPSTDIPSLIAIYWTDIDTRNGGDGMNELWARPTVDSDDLAISSEIIQGSGLDSASNFTALAAFVATWNRVEAYSQVAGAENTFQLIVAYNGGNTFVIFAYEQLEFFSASTAPRTVVGFNGPQGRGGELILSVGDNAAMASLLNGTNCGIPGTYVYRVSEVASVPTAFPTTTAAPSSFPTVSVANQDELVTCISVIDENDSKDVDGPWSSLRALYPDRPFCLLRPVSPGDSGVLSLPSGFFSDPRNIFANVTRNVEDTINPSDWYNLCNLDDGKARGLTSVILFVDNSGSLLTSMVQNAFDLFATRVAENGFRIVNAVENSSEDYIDPCLLTSLVTSDAVSGQPSTSPPLSSPHPTTEPTSSSATPKTLPPTTSASVAPTLPTIVPTPRAPAVTHAPDPMLATSQPILPGETLDTDGDAGALSKELTAVIMVVGILLALFAGAAFMLYARNTCKNNRDSNENDQPRDSGVEDGETEAVAPLAPTIPAAERVGRAAAPPPSPDDDPGPSFKDQTRNVPRNRRQQATATGAASAPFPDDEPGPTFKDQSDSVARKRRLQPTALGAAASAPSPDDNLNLSRKVQTQREATEVPIVSAEAVPVNLPERKDPPGKAVEKEYSDDEAR